MTDIEIDYQIPNDPDLSPEDLHPDAELQGADLSESKLSSMAIMEMDQATADRVDDFEDMRIVGTNMTMEDFSNLDTPSDEPRAVDLSNADLRDADLSDAWMISVGLEGASLRDSDLSNANMHNVDLSGSNLEGANLSNTDLTKSDLTNADLRNADLSGSKLSQANLTDAILYNADLSDTDLVKSNLANAHMRGANLSRANLKDADLSKANLIRASMADASLPFADLHDATLLNADLSGSNLTNANLDRTLLVETTLNRVSLSRGTSVSGISKEIKKYAPEESTTEQLHADIARVFHTLKSAYSENGLVGRARDARYKERRARREEAYADGGLRGYVAWLGSLLSNIFTGYGVRLRWVAGMMLGLYLLSAGVYHYAGTMPIGDSLYYSIVTFTTSPPSPPSSGLMRIVAGIETFAGTAAIVLLGYVLGTRERI